MLAIRMRKRGLRWNFRNDAHICIENATYEQNIMFFRLTICVFPPTML